MSVLAMAEITLSFERDISSVHRFYKIAASTTTPAAWTASQTAGYIANGTIVSGWSLTEPAYDNTATNSLYFFDLTVFSDNTYNKTDISKSSSYEAAKQAYEEAIAAQDAAAAIDQHFWFDETGTHAGAHITEVTQDEFKASPNTGANLFMKSNEVNLRKGLTPIAKFYTSSSDRGVIQLGSDQDDGGYNYTRLKGGDGTFELSTAGPWHPTSPMEGASIMEFITTNTYMPLNSYFKIAAAPDVAFEFNSNGNGGMACYLYHNGQVVLYGSNGDDTREIFSVSNLGDLTIMGHSTQIGTRTNWQPGTASTISTSQTWSKLPSSGKTLTAGTYLIIGSLNWSSNANGNRAARLYNETTSTALSHTEVQVRASTGATTRMQIVGSVVLDSTCSICVQVWQDSGSSRTVTPTFTYTRIA